MSKAFDHKKIEEKWQERWSAEKKHSVDLSNSENKLYALVMFSYPSGDKIHVGHWYNYGPSDTWARFKKMQGYRVFEPMGFDAFGLPAENYAIKHGIHPAPSTRNNIEHMTQQLKKIGAMYDWDKYLNTSDPEYYKWTQWLFLKLFNMGLAHREKAPVNWCPSCLTVLANEQVREGTCERCGTNVERKDLSQWFFKITKYADRLLAGLDNLNWPKSTKMMQRNWIGKSEGTTVFYDVDGHDERIEIFTTRVDTIYGATFIVLAPEHNILNQITTEDQSKDVMEYVKNTRNKSEIERITADKEKTGIFTGSYAINPITRDKLPIWISDFVLTGYGSGAIFGTPGHDQRDWEFATKFKLPIKQVIEPYNKEKVDLTKKVCSGEGILINSDSYNGLDYKEAIVKITKALESKGKGYQSVNYRLRDWLISRQRYWGAPIPIVYCETCGTVPVPEEDLPVLLPDDVDLEKNIGSESSPLADSESFVNVDCPKCGLKGRREVDTMDTFVDSSWYFLRYTNPHYSTGAWDSALVNEWLPVDHYVGGQDHATMHLFYARFVCMALFDNKLLNFEEPFTNLYHQGVITKDGAKMSKSKGNVVSPDPFIDNYGSDTFRMYLMFMGPYDEGGDWNDTGILGIHRFLNRVWRLCKGETDIKITEDSDKEMATVLHQTIREVSKDLQDMRFNTAISRIMEYVNALYKAKRVSKNLLESLILLLAPFAPHLSEELWESFGHKRSIFDHKWPEWDKNIAKSQRITVAVQIMGKLRGSFEIESDVTDDALVESALELPNIKKHMEGKTLLKSIVIKDKLVNFVVK